jgi:iron complex outermembrane receptor protein
VPQQKLALAFAVASCVLALAAHAQATAQAKERVEVTGSSIKRIDAETALPVQIITRQEIERTGVATTEELLKHVTAVTSFGSIVAAQSQGTITTSQSTVSLRGLGSTRTLVLVNGRRVAVFGGTTSVAVDVNSIPLAAIDRVEVLKEGASSLYGSDAIAGVVNFILRKDFTGGEAFASYGAPSRSGGGAEKNANAFVGFGDPDRYNLTLGLGWKKIDRIEGRDRAFARQINVAEGNDLGSTISFPGNILFGPTFARLASPAYPNCGPFSYASPLLASNPNTGSACRFENSLFLSVQPGQENKFGMMTGHLRLSSAVDAYFEANYTRNKTEYFTQPVPIAENTQLPAANPYNAFLRNLVATRYPNLPASLRRFVTQGTTLVLLPPTSPFYPTAFVASLGLPTNQPIAFRYRDFVQGLRFTEDSVDNTRVVAGLRGTLGSWDYDAGFLYSESKAKSNLITGYPLTSAFAMLLDTGVINPFGPTTDPTALAAADAAMFRGIVYSSKTSVMGVDAKVSRELWQLAGGPVGVAVGGQLNEERFHFDPSLAFQLGDIGGFGGNVFGVDRKRHVGSAYAEIAVPLLRSFEADVGVRYDNYQDVGSTTNPKLSLRWQPMRELLIRGSVGSGFRAPSLTDLYTPQAASVTANNTRDPIRCPNVSTGAAADCSNQFPTVTGGNPNLKPEKSLSRTLGVIFEPTPEISVGVDAFWINLKDSIVIGGLAVATILQNAQTATQFSSYILRGPPDSNPSGVGPIIGIVQTTSNLFKQKVTGYDVDIKWRVIPRRLLLSLNGTYFWHFDTQGPDGSYTPQLDRALRLAGGVLPRWKHTASATYTSGPWVASIYQYYQKSYVDALANVVPTPRKVSAYETWDGQLEFNGFRNLRLVGGVKNVFDRDPPYTNSAGQFAAGYDISYADVRGRFWYTTVRWTFK